MINTILYHYFVCVLTFSYLSPLLILKNMAIGSY